MAGKKLATSPAVALDATIHERVRLAILTALGSHGTLTFNELKELTDTSDGNLSTHTARLESAGYIAIKRSGIGRRRQSNYRITDIGRESLLLYLDALERLADEVRGDGA